MPLTPQPKTAMIFPYRAVLFDLDGTLAVQTLDFALMRARAMEALAPFTTAPDVPGMPLMEELERLCAGLPPQTAAEARAAALNAARRVEMEAAQSSRLFPFTRPLLAALKEAGSARAVVTRNCPEAVLTVFPDLPAYFDALLTRDDVPRVKPDPDHLLRALHMLGVLPENALMVGDHPMDIRAGKAAGTATAGVGSGATSTARLAEEHPDHLADNAGKLFRLLGAEFSF